MSADARKEFSRWIPDGNVGKFATSLPKNLKDNFDETMKLLRNAEFQDLLVNYPRAKRTFWVGYGVEERWQGKGVATEGTRAAVEWALAQPGVRIVTATTPPWHAASIRVLEKSGLVRVCTEDHETLGEVLRFERQARP